MNVDRLYKLPNSGSGLAVAGLVWSPAPAGRWRRGRASDVQLSWRGVVARLPSGKTVSPDLGGIAHTPLSITASALVQVCLGAQQAEQPTDKTRLWVAQVGIADRNAAEKEVTCWWMGATEDGVPSQIIPEAVFETEGAFCAALENALATTDIAGIMSDAACSELLEGLREARVARSDADGSDMPEVFTVTPAALDDLDAPRFERPARKSAARMAAFAVLLAIPFLGGTWLTGAFTSEPPPVPVVARWSAPVPGAFTAGCKAVLGEDWPRMPGWHVSLTGCARSGHLPSEIENLIDGQRDLIVWRRYSRSGAANAVLAGAAARQLTSDYSDRHAWFGEPRDQLLLWSLQSLRYEEVDPDHAAPLEQAVQHLAQGWADEPGAVGREGAEVRLEVSDPPVRALERLAEIGAATSDGPATELLSITWTGQRTYVRLRPRTGDRI